jgi:hypothetical protein
MAEHRAYTKTVSAVSPDNTVEFGDQANSKRILNLEPTTLYLMFLGAKISTQKI